MNENQKDKIKSVKTDGEEVTFFDPEQIAEGENWQRKKAVSGEASPDIII